ncbi:hypothetical protein BH10BAC4_BH10BAC4_12450 [soil metagenome]
MKKYTTIIAAILLIVFTTQAQIIKTSLTLTVRDELGNTVEGVSVKLFEKEADYTAETNPSEEGTTDAKGVVRFKNLKAIAYFVLARKGDKDNAGGGEKTGALEAKRINKSTIVIQ